MSPASTSIGFSSRNHVNAAKSLCLNKHCHLIVTLASTAIILSSLVFKTGLISNKEASDFT